MRRVGTPLSSSKTTVTRGRAGEVDDDAAQRAEQLVDVDLGDAHDVAPGGEARQVEVVVDEVERLLHRAVDEPDVLAQARVQAVAALAQDRLGHAAHRVQRRAQLVGQRSQEARVARRALAQLLRLLTELGQQRGDGAVGVDELAVEPDELALALAQRGERAHELGVLHAQLVERGLGLARLVALERAHDVRELLEARQPGVLLELAGQPHEHRPARRRAPRRGRRAGAAWRGRGGRAPRPGSRP